MRFSTILSLSHCRNSIKPLRSFPQTKLIKPNNKSIHKNPRKKNPSKPTKSRNLYTRDIVANIYNILKYSTWESAEQQLTELPIKWDSHIINKVLKTHPPMQKAWLFFNWVATAAAATTATQSKLNFKHDHFTYTTMLDIFGEAGRLESMYYLFDRMKQKGLKIDAVTYTSLMHWVSRAGDVDAAVRLWEEMKEKGLEPTVVTYTAYMKILLGGGRVEEAREVYREMIGSRVPPNVHTYTVIMEYLVGAGKFEGAVNILLEMQEAGVKPDKAACNILIEKSCKVGGTQMIKHVLHYMKENRVVLRYPVFFEALKALKAAGESDSLLREVHPHISIDSVTNDEADEITTVAANDTASIDRGMIYILLKKQNLVALDRMLEEMTDKNIKLDSFLVSTIIEVNCDRCRLDGALLAFDCSIKMGLYLERTAYLALLGNSMRSNTFPAVVEIVREMVNAKRSLGVYFATTLIHRLRRKTRLAAEIFHLLPDEEKGTAAYTALIGVYFFAGSPEKAIKMYKEMRQKGISPSIGTYNVVLSGLDRSGSFPEEAESLRKEKKSLMNNSRFRENVPAEEKISDLLFARNLQI